MFERLIELTSERGLDFGVKLTNTFPVDVARRRAAQRRDVHDRPHPLPPHHRPRCAASPSSSTASLRISYSGGADYLATSRALYRRGHLAHHPGHHPCSSPAAIERMSQIAGEFAELTARAVLTASPSSRREPSGPRRTRTGSPLYRNPLRKLPCQAGRSPSGVPLHGLLHRPLPHRLPDLSRISRPTWRPRRQGRLSRRRCAIITAPQRAAALSPAPSARIHCGDKLHAQLL